MKDGCTIAKCKDCGRLVDTFSMQGAWCEDCFDRGLIKDMDDHFRNTIKSEMEEAKRRDGEGS